LLRDYPYVILPKRPGKSRSKGKFQATVIFWQEAEMRPGIRPVPKKSKKKKRNVAAWQVGVLAAGLLAVLGLLYSLTFGGRQARKFNPGESEVRLMQKQIDQGLVLNTPPEELRKLGIKLPAGYDEQAAAQEARAQGGKN
jgi:hypothetical protein